MSKPVLYLLVGYPGAGKTTVSRIISEATGAEHLWADVERHMRFGRPTHSHDESVQLYEELNQRAGQLLAAGKSVVFDTNFNFRSDRDKLREIAGQQGADAVVVWITVPKQTAKQRAVGTRQSRNGYENQMSEEQFDAIVAKLEPPDETENVIKIDGAKIDKQALLRLLSQHGADISLP